VSRAPFVKKEPRFLPYAGEKIVQFLQEGKEKKRSNPAESTPKGEGGTRGKKRRVRKSLLLGRKEGGLSNTELLDNRGKE